VADAQVGHLLTSCSAGEISLSKGWRWMMSPPQPQNTAAVKGAINRFLEAFPAFPGGFDSQFYRAYERRYKENTAQFVAERLAKEQLDELIASRDYEEIGLLARRALNNLVFRSEQIALHDALRTKAVAQPFAEGLRELLYGEFEFALEALAALLRPHNAAKWPILTFWPFFRFPNRHMFLKPTIVRICAGRLGYELHYERLPNRTTYQSLLGFTEFLRAGIAELKPRDNIDLQTFMYAVAKEGYVQQAITDWEDRLNR
jgi:hypothetical protein